ncbi:MAG: DUF378 domain-containing protein, partial [Candidatus Gracilibacteria bacterium]
MKVNALDYIALLFVVAGALNWGLVGLFNWNLVDFLFVNLVGLAIVAKVLYIVIALAGVYLLISMFTKGQ